MIASSVLVVLQVLSGFFSQTHRFLKNQTQEAHSNATEECISSMIKTSSHCSLSLSWTLLSLMLVKSHFNGNHHTCSKKWKKSTAEYNRQHSSQNIEVLRQFSVQIFVQGDFSTEVLKQKLYIVTISKQLLGRYLYQSAISTFLKSYFLLKVASLGMFVIFGDRSRHSFVVMMIFVLYLFISMN